MNIYQDIIKFIFQLCVGFGIFGVITFVMLFLIAYFKKSIDAEIEDALIKGSIVIAIFITSAVLLKLLY